MTKIFATLLILILNSLAFSKGGKLVPPSDVESLITSGVAIQSISVILGQVVDGSRKITDNNCPSVAFIQNATAFEAEVNSEMYYILKEGQALNGINYNASACRQLKSLSSTQIECVAKPSSPIDLTNTHDLVFYIKWNDSNNMRSLEKCPQKGSINYQN